ncbi:putative isopentenyl pyrophosphate isomerase [Rickettsia bellii str. RML Mogi]|uniref:Putative isopentenyl pyrophosphate isomerase n=1 Tax=Rickettsia bellii str. RML Mogi TaxID=1359194 RepID=A0A0F3QKM3_RICBE|nr:putative isopentenyl pyrophosphate isomerase [Rickettsia bellii str. RML Mogi]
MAPISFLRRQKSSNKNSFTLYSNIMVYDSYVIQLSLNYL